MLSKEFYLTHYSIERINYLLFSGRHVYNEKYDQCQFYHRFKKDLILSSEHLMWKTKSSFMLDVRINNFIKDEHVIFMHDVYFDRDGFLKMSPNISGSIEVCKNQELVIACRELKNDIEISFSVVIGEETYDFDDVKKLSKYEYING